MSEKRRDNRNRILREGEYQRKDGRYRFRYIDEDGKEKNVYSWRLDKNDPMPKGKKREPSLREKEKQIEADLFDRIVTNGGNYTVLELVEKYVSLKTGVRHNTVAGYKTVINMLKKESFGNLRIDKVRLSDAKAWLIKLQQIDGRGYSSIHSIRGVLRPAFQMAVDDDLLRKNPFEFELASVIVNDSVTREAITRKQQRDLLKFIQEDKHFSRYYDAIYILFHTGLRISEFCGLTVSEIEFGEMRIKVDHQLQRTAQMQYVIEEPKTDKGIRYVPMTEAVAACFRRIIANRKTPKVEPMVEGYAGFLFLDKNDMPMVALHWEKYLEHIGVPLFFLLRRTASNSAAAFCMIIVMLPFFLLAMYERHGQPLEVVAGQVIRCMFLRTKERPYQTNNFYAALERQAQAEKEVKAIVQKAKARAAGTADGKTYGKAHRRGKA